MRLPWLAHDEALGPYITIPQYWLNKTKQHTQRGDRGIYSIWGGRSLYCLHFGISQLVGSEACFGMFVRALLG